MKLLEPISILPHHSGDGLLRTIRIRWMEGGDVRAVEFTGCQYEMQGLEGMTKLFHEITGRLESELYAKRNYHESL